MKKLLFILALALVACQPEPVEVWVPPTHTPIIDSVKMQEDLETILILESVSEFVVLEEDSTKNK